MRRTVLRARATRQIWCCDRIERAAQPAPHGTAHRPLCHPCATTPGRAGTEPQCTRLSFHERRGLCGSRPADAIGQICSEDLIAVDDRSSEDLNRTKEPPSMQEMRNRGFWELGLDLVPAGVQGAVGLEREATCAGWLVVPDVRGRVQV